MELNWFCCPTSSNDLCLFFCLILLFCFSASGWVWRAHLGVSSCGYFFSWMHSSKTSLSSIIYWLTRYMVIPFFYLDSITIGAIVAFFKLPVMLCCADFTKTKIKKYNFWKVGCWGGGNFPTSPPIPHPSPLDLLPIENKNIVMTQSQPYVWSPAWLYLDEWHGFYVS